VAGLPLPLLLLRALLRIRTFLRWDALPLNRNGLLGAGAYLPHCLLPVVRRAGGRV